MVQFIQITPEELEDAIVIRIQGIINDVKEHLEPKTPIEYLSREQVSKLLDIDLSTLWAWTKKGKLKSYAIKGSNRIYYKRKEIEQAMVQISH